MKIGDIVESAIWLTGDEPEDLRTRYEGDVKEAINCLCEDEGFLHNEVKFVEHHPEESGIPNVPDHINGSRVRLLRGETVLVSYRPVERPVSFVANLDAKDLGRLQQITRKAHYKHFNKNISDIECNDIIESLGPEAGLAALKQAVDNGVVH